MRKFSVHPSRRFPKTKKSLGQHFLVDGNITRKIISACALKPTDTVLEIGPGCGVLTFAIAPLVRKIIAIEKDARLCAKLKTESPHKNITVVHGDILAYDFDSLPTHMRVVGNLPYYISSPIIEKLIVHRRHFSDIYVTVQLEFGKRIVAEPDTKDYSSLSLFAQYYTEPSLLFKIKPTSFRPPPKVDSCFMRLGIRKKPPYRLHNESLLWMVIAHAFQQRRKTLGNALSRIISKNELTAVLTQQAIHPQSRAENLTIRDFVAIANALYQRKGIA